MSFIFPSHGTFTNPYHPPQSFAAKKIRSDPLCQMRMEQFLAALNGIDIDLLLKRHRVLVIFKGLFHYIYITLVIGVIIKKTFLTVEH